jgi:hypothetical protein
MNFEKENLCMKDNNLINRLNRHPKIKARLEELLNVSENLSGEFNKADDAEEALAEGIRKIGLDLLQDWAECQNNLVESKTKNSKDLKCHAKKNFTGNHRLVKSK